jgi:hypothetical protein
MFAAKSSSFLNYMHNNKSATHKGDRYLLGLTLRTSSSSIRNNVRSRLAISCCRGVERRLLLLRGTEAHFSYQLLEVFPVVAAIGEVDEEVSALVLLLTGIGEVGQNASISVVNGIIVCGCHKLRKIPQLQAL